MTKAYTQIVQEKIPADEYVDAFNVIKSICDERQILSKWLTTPETLSLSMEDQDLTFLSVGSGSGDFDFTWIESFLRQGARNVTYTAIEPSPLLGAALRARAAQNPRVKLVLLPSTFEDAKLTGKYDLILCMHSLYYMEDKAAALARLASHLGGVMVLIHQATQGVSLIQKHFVTALGLKKDPGMAAESLLDILDQTLELAYTYQIVSTTIETTAVLDPGSKIGPSLFRFLLNVDPAQLHEHVLNDFCQFVRDLSYEHRSRWWMHQPLGVQIIRV